MSSECKLRKFAKTYIELNFNKISKSVYEREEENIFYYPLRKLCKNSVMKKYNCSTTCFVILIANTIIYII